MSGADFDSEMFADLLSDFLDESSQLLSVLNERLLEFDQWLQEGTVEAITADQHLDAINEVFRAAHSLKGGSAMLGLTNVNKLTHKMENVLDEVRAGKLALRRALLDVVFRSIDRLESMMNRLREDRDSEVSAEDQEFMNWLEAEHAQATLGMATLTAEESTETAAGPELADEVEFAHEDYDTSIGTTEALADEETDLTESDSPQAEESAPLPASTAAAAPAPAAEELFDVSSYLTLYLDEVDEQTDRLNELLLTMESDSENPETLGEMFRMAHSIKGSAASMGFKEVKELTHEIESYFDQLRNKSRAIDEKTVNVIFGALDVLRDYHRSVREGNAQPGPLAHQIERVVAAVRGLPLHEDEAIDIVALVFEERPWSGTRPGYRLSIQFEQGLSIVSLKGELIVHRLEGVGEVIGCQPTLEMLDQVGSTHRFIVDIATEASEEAVRRAADVDGVAKIEITSYQGDGSLAAPAPVPVAPVVSPVAVKPAPAVPSTPTRNVAPPPAPAPIEHELDRAPAPVPSTNSSARSSSKESSKETGGESQAKVAETLRVEIDRLDQLMNLAGELVINKARFVQISAGLQELFRGKGAQYAAREMRQRLAHISHRLEEAKASGKQSVDFDSLRTEVTKLSDNFAVVREELDRVQRSRSEFNSLSEAIHQLTRVADGIQKSVMDTRMVPVGPLFVRFKRVVRDVARTAGKDVTLDIQGEKTELDKRMIDELGDPLVHLVRNAVDHGLEPPDQRLAAGKSRTGTVRLEAMHRGNCVVVEVSDDGRGIDPSRIRKRVLERGLASEAELDAMSEKQILQFIWAAGFSTAEAVTDISGRGVGLDIVRSKIEELSGTVEVQSEVGKGTVFIVRLPLTLAILPSLLSQVYDEVYAFPLESVEEIVAIPAEEVYTVQGIRTIKVRGRVISLVSLDDVFLWGGTSHPRAKERSESAKREFTVVICQSAGAKLGVVVDLLIGEEDVVIKSLAENFENVVGLAGASILGDGRVSLILDIGSIVELAQKPRRASA